MSKSRYHRQTVFVDTLHVPTVESFQDFPPRPFPTFFSGKLAMNMLTKLRLAITRRKQEQEVQLLCDYRHLVRCLANNQKVDDDKAFELLTDAGKDIDTLETDVRIFQERRNLAKKIREIPEIKDQIRRTNAKLQQMQSKLDAVLVQNREVDDSLKALEIRLQIAETAREKLIRSLNTESETAEALQELRARRRELIEPLSHFTTALWGRYGKGNVSFASEGILGGQLFVLLGNINSDLRSAELPLWLPEKTALNKFGRELQHLDPLSVENYGWWYSPDHRSSVKYLRMMERGNENVSKYRLFYESNFMPAVQSWLNLLRQERAIEEQKQAIFDAELNA